MQLLDNLSKNLTYLTGRAYELLNNNIGIAVSGGSDSIALLYLMKEWSEQNLAKIHIFTVDHDLRKESKEETDYVASLANSFGFKCTKLKWNHHGNLSNLQAKARQARYDLITHAANKEGVKIVLTAHHLDDYIENYHIKKEKKSGLLGSSNGYIHFHNDVMIIRPMFDITKQELVDYLRDKKAQWFEDSSNKNTKYLRNSIRAKIQHTPCEEKSIILKQQELIDFEAHHLQKIFLTEIAERCMISPLGFATIEIQNPKSIEIELHLINFVLTIISGHKTLPRSRSTLPLIDLMYKEPCFTKTLHGCVVKKIENHLVVYREFGRIAPNNILLEDKAIWDRRFTMNTPHKFHDFYISHLSISEYTSIKDVIDLSKLADDSFNNHKEILLTIPIIKTFEKIVAIPNICYYNDNVVDGVEINFSPSFVSRFTHFY